MLIARIGDVHVCPLHGPNAIVSCGKALVGGLPVARMGDTTACGATILKGSTLCLDGGKPVAYVGSPTSHGGLITTGSPLHNCMP